ncbi:DUF1800 domain-containing protein [Chthonobacter albigriseus]|uniref:DUF1800 domain-containing protein n=1 Tax=Chthonobacter albigriseus TaxID=1683161 RepID=UPI0015EED93A|nr:DUF1800 domain-containing protein [Chthonobacter albigriseus]
MSRRALLQGGAGGLTAALVLGGLKLPRAFALQAPDAAADRAALGRLTFGPTRAELQRLQAMGLEAWLDEQLALPDRDADLDRRLGAIRLKIAYEAGTDENGGSWPAAEKLRPLGFIADEATEPLVDLTDWQKPMAYGERTRPADEVIAASLVRAVHAPAQLREVITQFWHDHFSVNALANEVVAAHFARHDAAIRSHALGNFRALLGAVARSPSMLAYLNNADSRASPANENYARELLELHTLGADNYWAGRADRWDAVPGATDGLAAGYLDDDVYEVARAFTGWTIGDGRWVADGETTPRTGAFAYVDAWHDPYQKRVLGRELAAYGAPMADGEAVLDILAAHPGTARFVCAKLVRRLLADDPPAVLVEQAAESFLDHRDAPDQIARVVRTIVLSEPFTATPPAKLKRPFEHLASLARALGADVAVGEHIGWALPQTGWRQHQWRLPNGHPDVAAAWSNTATVAGMVTLTLQVFEDWFGLFSGDPLDAIASGAPSVRACVREIADRLLVAPADDRFIAAVAAAVAEDLDSAVPDGDWERSSMLRGAVLLVALSPEFLAR